MDELLKTAIEQAPNLLGFAILSWVLWQLVNKLTDALLQQLGNMQEQLVVIAQKLDSLDKRQ